MKKFNLDKLGLLPAIVCILLGMFVLTIAYDLLIDIIKVILRVLVEYWYVFCIAFVGYGYYLDKRNGS